MASLTAKTGTLGHRLAAHLIRRTTYHPTKALIDSFAAMTVTQAINSLMTEQALNVPIPIDWKNGGNPWIDPTTNFRYLDGPNAPLSTNPFLRRYIRSHWLDEARLDQTIHHKMTFFLHSIWVIDGGTSIAEEYWNYFRLLRYSALGNFKELAKKMTLDRQMLRYLDNHTNNKNNPNENYAREFLELFTIGKGEQVGDGDYTTFQELDVAMATKVLTGWKINYSTIFDDIDPETNIARGYPSFGNHDLTDKTFSSAFGNHTITAATDADDMFRELDDFVEMVFAQEHTALNICRRMYQFFVSRKITEEIETDIIAPLATTLRDNDYVLEPALRQLLSSVHFYDEDDSSGTDEIIGAMIKSPVDLTLHAMNFFEVSPPDPHNSPWHHYHGFYYRAFQLCFGQNSGMHIWEPTSVAGYPAYYQEPIYHRNWFNSATIVSRYKLPEQLLTNSCVINENSLAGVQFFVVPFMANSGIFTDPGDASLLVMELATYLYCEMPDSERLQYFVDVLVGDFDEAYWADLWTYYINSNEEDMVKSPLEDLFKAMLYAPEFQLM